MVTLVCAIVGAGGNAFPVDIEANLYVSHLKKAIKVKRMYDFPADKLKLFLAKKDGEWLKDDDPAALQLEKEEIHDVQKMTTEEQLKTTWTIDDVLIANNMTNERAPKSKQIHVLVVVPPDVGSKRPTDDEVANAVKRLKLIEPKTLTEFTPLSVNEDEFRLDNLSMTRQRDNPIVITSTLREFWKEFGEFPPYYFVRMEEVVFWKVIEKLLFGKDRVVIVGSPGVGKSCFLILIAFYLACIKRKKVLVVRRLKQRKRMNAVVFLDGRGSYARLSNLSPQDINAIRGQAQDVTILVDGFNQAEVENYMPFVFLATLCQFYPEHDDSSRIVVLPAWRDTDLLHYAKSTNWVIETGLRKIKQQNIPLAKLVKEQYFYSGGSLREFCKERRLLEERVAKDCRAVDNEQAFELVYNYDGGQSKRQVDCVLRHYITDCNREVEYHNSRWWFLSVDSGYVLSQLGREIDTGKHLKAYTYAKSVGAGFHGVAYKLLLHNAVRGAFVKRKPVVLKMREGSKYEKIEIRVPNVACSGEDEASCYSCLSTLQKNTYWSPDYPFFPFIDAVTTCEAFQSGSEDSETIVAYIQVTIRSEKEFKEERLSRLNEEMDKTQSLKNMKRAFVVVGPDSDVCERFILHDAPDPNTFLAMVSCFSPEQLEPEVS